MKEKIIIPVLALLLSALLIACGDGSGETKKDEQTGNKKLPIVKVKEVETIPFSSSLSVVGVIKPYASVKISSEEGGLIVALNKDKGSYVGKGEIIARVKKDIEIATYEQTEAQVELARINYEKQKQLYDDNATTEIQYLTAKWQYEAALRSQDVLKQRLKTGYIRSPISGVVDEKYMNKGEMSAPGSPIFNIIDISRVKISAGIPETYVTQIKKGQNVTITCNVIPGAEFEGKISYISPSLSATNRTFEVEIIINNREKLLKPEMSVNVNVISSYTSDAIVMAQDMIVDLGPEKYVFVSENGIAKKRVITLGGREGNQVMIVSGLNKGDILIYEGYQQLSDGDSIMVIE